MNKDYIQISQSNAPENLSSGKPMRHENGILTPLMKQPTDKALLAVGNSYRPIRAHTREIYGIGLPDTTLGKTPDNPLQESWRRRDLEPTCATARPEAINAPGANGANSIRQSSLAGASKTL